MTVRQAADLLGVTSYRVHAMIRAGQLSKEQRTTDVGTTYYLLKRAEVEALAEARRKRAAGERPPGLPGPRPKTREQCE